MTPVSALPVCLSHALAYAKRGWPVFPLHSALPGEKCTCGNTNCHNQGKHPRTEHGLRDATTDERRIRAWWSRWPDANVGIATGFAGLVAVDIDPRNGGAETWAELSYEHGISEQTISVETGGGGRHYYHSTGDKKIKSKSGVWPGIDIKSDGGYVVAPPSNHISGKSYRFLDSCGPVDCEPTPLPQWLADGIAASQRSKASGQQPQADCDGWTAVAFREAGWLGRKLPNGAWIAECPWQASHTTGSVGDSSSVVFPPRVGSTLGYFHCSHGHCSNRTASDVRRALPAAAVSAANAAYPRTPKPPAQAEPAPKADDAWRSELACKEDGSVLPTIGNAISILAHDPRWAGVLAWDEFRDTVCFRKPPPWHPDDAPLVPHDVWHDSDATRLSAWFGRFWAIKLSVELAYKVIDLIARRYSHHPVREWLLDLRWDLAPRAESWLQTYLGVADSAYSRAVSKRWLVSLVARAFAPGCRADCILILEGPQGAKKSSALAALVGDEWFADSIGDIANKDSADALMGKWLIEIGELLAHNKTDNESWKAFTSRRIDHYRPAYARITVDRPRHCVFAATTNQDHYITDPTGARRNWAVKVGTIDIDALKRDREVLLAEAVALYQGGEQWWLTDAEVPEQEDEQAARRITDPWESSVVVWLAEQDDIQREVTVSRALGALGIEPAQRTFADARRIGAIFKVLGYEPVGFTLRKRGEKHERCYAKTPRH